MRELIAVLDGAADAESAGILARYFQVRPGGYGEGDVFLGIKLSQLRKLAKPYYGLTFRSEDWIQMLRSPVHEHRLTCLVVMSQRALALGRTPAAPEFTHLYETYLAHTAHINNWDLIDVSAGPVLGGYLLTRQRDVLYRLAQSSLWWERRIAMVSTQKFIGAGQTADVYRLAELLLHDPHDLTHKAVGWMLREAGKRVDLEELRAFLDEHADQMPRTTLRYAIERLEPDERQRYLARERR